MNTKELIDLAEKYDTSRSIRWNADKLHITKRNAEDLLLINNVKSYFKICEDKMSIQNVKTNCEDKMSIQNVKTNCEDSSTEPEYFNKIDEYFNDIDMNIQDVLRYGEPSQFFIQDVMERMDIRREELNNYFNNRKSAL